ncbi:hypothetical protein BCR37DRAFT_254462 [Protomyces lactucae-debilis]|uniref:Uncharacterized protein n=1 Tax=Protomyces lactucae-debilis TaxID=2754530 RepID=A0A1Y2FNI5_PROLT|nr:uncharacterized protein BCR37DRAFT_254462 [Protomyces lactucae-debilis]ORY84904.1 hypothetical protein BCR37DRAFT_254462 [Protomyces lactucae-debilis]
MRMRALIKVPQVCGCESIRLQATVLLLSSDRKIARVMHEFPRSCLKETLTPLEQCVKCDFHFRITGLKSLRAFKRSHNRP